MDVLACLRAKIVRPHLRLQIMPWPFKSAYPTEAMLPLSAGSASTVHLLLTGAYAVNVAPSRSRFVAGNPVELFADRAPSPASCRDAHTTSPTPSHTVTGVGLVVF